jgi:hypothetical protein
MLVNPTKRHIQSEVLLLHCCSLQWLLHIQLFAGAAQVTAKAVHAMDGGRCSRCLLGCKQTHKDCLFGKGISAVQLHGHCCAHLQVAYNPWLVEGSPLADLGEPAHRRPPQHVHTAPSLQDSHMYTAGTAYMAAPIAVLHHSGCISCSDVCSEPRMPPTALAPARSTYVSAAASSCSQNYAGHCRCCCCCCVSCHSRFEGHLCIVCKVILNLSAQETLILVLQNLHSTSMQHSTAQHDLECAHLLQQAVTAMHAVQ